MSFRLQGTVTCDGCGIQATAFADATFIGTFHEPPPGWARTTKAEDVCPSCVAKIEARDKAEKEAR